MKVVGGVEEKCYFKNENRKYMERFLLDNSPYAEAANFLSF